jgi:predicted HicB family RNase H-like nuclease
MNYPMRLYTVETVEGPEWIAEFVDIFGCGGGGNTAQEALKDALVNLEYYLEFAKERGEDIPQPSDYNECNGKIALRIPKSMHRRLLKLSADEGKSLNQVILDLFDRKLGGNE